MKGRGNFSEFSDEERLGEDLSDENVEEASSDEPEEDYV